ncbi:MAG: SLBB domain-containing protein [Candidatus Methylomirabilales bacterium]
MENGGRISLVRLPLSIFRLPLLAVLLIGCATQSPPIPGAGVSIPIAHSLPQAPDPETMEESPLPPPVVENQTFITLDGVPRYKIGPGDVLEVLLTRGFLQEKQTVAVKANGMVTVVSFEAKVAGLTTEQAAEEIRRVLSPFYKELSVEVLVKEYNSKKVTVLGAVGGKAGTFPLKGRMTLLDLLAEAGGPAPNADLERVRVIHPDGSSLTMNLFRLLEEPVVQTFILDTGDVVFIPTRGPAEEPKIFVLGEVRNPGAFPLIPNMRLSQALALAGGPTDVAVLESARIIRGGLSNPQLVGADFRKVLQQGDLSQDLLLQANDLIVLPRSAIGNWNAFIAKIRPTLEILTLPLALPVQIRVLER